MSTAELRTVTADEVADYIIWDSNDRGSFLSNQKLQKLLYYVQAWHLATHGRSLFDGVFEAGVRGPIFPSLYDRYSRYKGKHIDEQVGRPQLPAEVEEFVQEVLAVYGEMDARKLERLVWGEDPWRLPRERAGLADDDPARATINEREMERYYRARMAADVSNGSRPAT